MQIVFACAGSRGDTQPYIAFAVEVSRMVFVTACRDLCAPSTCMHAHPSTCAMVSHLHTHPSTYPSIFAPTTRALHSHLHSYPPSLVDRARLQLVRAGHEVRLYIAPEYQPLVPTLAGLSVTCSQQTLTSAMEKVEPYIANGNQAALFQALVDTAVECYAQETDAIKAVCEGWAEVVIFSGLAAPYAYAVTEVRP